MTIFKIIKVTSNVTQTSGCKTIILSFKMHKISENSTSIFQRFIQDSCEINRENHLSAFTDDEKFKNATVQKSQFFSRCF